MRSIVREVLKETVSSLREVFSGFVGYLRENDAIASVGSKYSNLILVLS